MSRLGRACRGVWTEFTRRPLVHVLGALVLVSTLLSALTSLAALDAQREAEAAQDATRELTLELRREVDERVLQVCLAINQNRADGRELERVADTEAGEALIDTAGASTPDEARAAAIELYRLNLRERLTQVLADHAAGDLDCGQDPRE